MSEEGKRIGGKREEEREQAVWLIVIALHCTALHCYCTFAYLILQIVPQHKAPWRVIRIGKVQEFIEESFQLLQISIFGLFWGPNYYHTMLRPEGQVLIEEEVLFKPGRALFVPAFFTPREKLFTLVCKV